VWETTTKRNYSLIRGDDETRLASVWEIAKRACWDIGQNISESTDRMADICIDEKLKEKKEKSQRIKKETILLANNIHASWKQNWTKLKFKQRLYHAAYNSGKVSHRLLRNTLPLKKT